MKRIVKKVELKSRPELSLYVRALNCIEDGELRAARRLIDAETDEGQLAMVYSWLSAYLCDQGGAQLCATPDDAKKFIADNILQTGACWKVIHFAQEFNALSDEAVEEERKN